MSIAQSKITAQGQIAVPAEVCKKLGVGPGSILEWDEENDRVVVRRAAKSTSLDVHRALFPGGHTRPPMDVKEGLRKHIRSKHARG